jgi:formate hydrogenlyase subunit 3/multisubunit Na+/H+ antiporter MnhD subunit
MSSRMKAAFTCYLLGVLIAAGFGVVYLFRSEFMPYHAVAVGQSWEALQPAVRILVLALMRAVAAGCIAVAFLELVLLFVPFRQGAAWARWAIPAGGLVMCAGALYAMILVKLNTPAQPPLFGPVLGAVLLVTGFMLARERRK